MPRMQTSLGLSGGNPKKINYQTVAPLTATNVEDAINQMAGIVAPTAIAVTFDMSPYTPPASAQLLFVDTTAGAVTIQMPLSSSRTFDLEVKDVAGNSAVNAISVVCTAPGLIDGLSAYRIDSPYASAKFGVKTGGYYVHA